MSETQHQEAHTGPIKTPKQLMIACVLAFVVPVFASMALAIIVVR